MSIKKDTEKRPTRPELTHFDATGKAHMVDIGSKSATQRVAIAVGNIRMNSATLGIIQSGGSKKGDVLGVARIAAIMAAKRAAELIPLCHPISLTQIAVDFEMDFQASCVNCRAHVETCGQTGVEIEALAAVQVGLLTIYDMCKAVDREMSITDIKILKKRGGKTPDWGG